MSRDWYYLSGSRHVGPLALNDLAVMARQGRLEPEAQVRQGRKGSWIVARRVAGVFNFTATRLPPPLPSATAIEMTDVERAEHDAKVNRVSGGAMRVAPLDPGFVALAGIALVGIIVIVASWAGSIDAASEKKMPRRDEVPHFNSTPPLVAPVPSKESPDTDPAVDFDTVPSASDVIQPVAGGETRPARIEATSEDARNVPSDWIERIAERGNRSVVRIETSEGLGTGFVIASRGDRHLLLTNKHVLTVGENSFISRATLPSRCRVVLTSKTTVLGRVAALAKSPDVDLAIVLVESSELQTLAPIASFESIKVGEEVVAIGNPLGLDNTVTQGIISGKRADIMLQTSAPINHGNSGGPLVNKYGRVVAVNTLSGDPSKGVQGIGFAMRADIALRPDEWEYVLEIKDLFEEIPH
ncbi:MAG TPA: trypsin-like peptidase domain-containing protein [Pirellulales bacterium]|jgi:S1-C subfamily serine protease|nr:trypsin-like peptidase domain-containing protein [Pirellulales bacterium]